MGTVPWVWDPAAPGKAVVQKKGVHMGRGGIIWTIVGVLLIIALIIYIF